MARLRSVAFYLPQYHPIRLNDEAWGPGFTEWFNVVKARPRFRGHEQPHLPADLGFYDLRLSATREAQADLAKKYGVDAFCYYHYWFDGRRLLEQPFAEVLASGTPGLPFMLCWANENWTRVWDGGDKHILAEQNYSDEDDRAHIKSLLPVFRDHRYVCVDGKPVFLVYRASRLPDPARTMAAWREEAAKAGLAGLYLMRVEGLAEDRSDPQQQGFDASVEFHPHAGSMGPRVVPGRGVGRTLRRVLRPTSPYRTNRVYSYARMVEAALQKESPNWKRYRCVTPMWDNSARRATGARIIIGSRPELYESWLRRVVDNFTPFSKDENFVFVNAWNEWAEGNHLEPDQRWGHRYLEAHRTGMHGSSANRFDRPH